MATFTNQAPLLFNNTVTNSNIATGELVDLLTLEQAVLRDEYTVNDRLVYVITLVNAGSTPLTGLTVTSDMGGYLYNGATLYPLDYVEGSILYYLDGALQPPPVMTTGSPLVFHNITVPANGSTVLVYEAAANQYAPLGPGGVITNTATVTGASLAAPISDSAAVTPEDEADLTICKGLSPSAVTENRQITYTITLQNYGSVPATAQDNAVVTDDFDPILSGLSVTFNGAPWTEGTNYTYDQTTGAFATNAGQITVPAATYSQDPETGAWTTEPGSSTLAISGTI